jgi:hypothetical protein
VAAGHCLRGDLINAFINNNDSFFFHDGPPWFNKRLNVFTLIGFLASKGKVRAVAAGHCLRGDLINAFINNNDSFFFHDGPPWLIKN